MRHPGLSLALVLCVVFTAMPALAAVITVTTTADELTTNGNCSLREAIRAANLNIAVDACTAGTGTDEISLPSGVYTLTIPTATNNENAALNGDLDVTGTVTITGADAATTIVEGCAVVPPATACTGVDRVFDVQPGANVTITGVTIRHGTAFLSEAGGGLRNQGTLQLVESVISDNVSGATGGGLRNVGAALATVTRTIVTGNRAPTGGGISTIGMLVLADSVVSGNVATNGSGFGGGINNNGAATITDSTIAGNQANAGAGIINQISGEMTVTGSTINGNTGAEHGGGIQNDGTMTLTNTTVSGNRADSSGGGILNIGTAATLSLINTTVTANTVPGQAGGLRVSSGTVVLEHTILAANVDTNASLLGHSPDCVGTVTSQGHNLVGTVGTLATGAAACTGVTGGVNGDQVGTAGNPIDPGLTPLADHGGPSLTHGLLGGSPAINAGDPAGCTDGAGAALTTDQRGFARPVGPACDIGAFEGVAAAGTALSHFLCYRAQTTVRTPSFPGVYGVSLVDAFERRRFDVRTASRLCTPADTEGEGLTDLETHLEGYEIALTPTRPAQPGHVPQLALRVENQFGSLTVDTLKPERLMVPTARSLTGPVAPPVPEAHGVDHYKCYLVRISRGTPTFQRRTVTVSDQFSSAKVFEVQDMLEVCLPVDKQGEGLKNPAAHLACYRAKPAVAHVPVGGVYVSNQFGAERLDVLRDVTLCVPSTLTD